MPANSLSLSKADETPKFQEPASHPWLHPVLCLIVHGDPAEASLVYWLVLKLQVPFPLPPLPLLPLSWLLCFCVVWSASGMVCIYRHEQVGFGIMEITAQWILYHLGCDTAHQLAGLGVCWVCFSIFKLILWVPYGLGMSVSAFYCDEVPLSLVEACN